mmetsp:Transcript_9268/g.8716  ORF Transcript_9268/g.8716 Transcript_9268/m.8716 type:complete len:87 (-) Transcript_9268:829-1089(-)
MASYIFVLDESVTTIERRAFNFVDVVQKLGGMLGSISTFCIVISQLVKKGQFHSYLMLETMKVDESEDGISLKNGTMDDKEGKIIE